MIIQYSTVVTNQSAERCALIVLYVLKFNLRCTVVYVITNICTLYNETLIDSSEAT